MIKNVYFSLCKVHVFLVQLQRNAYFLYRFSKKKNSNIKYQENPSSRSRFVPCERTDGQTDMTTLQSLFAILQWRLKKLREPDARQFVPISRRTEHVLRSLYYLTTGNESFLETPSL